MERAQRTGLIPAGWRWFFDILLTVLGIAILVIGIVHLSHHRSWQGVANTKATSGCSDGNACTADLILPDNTCVHRDLVDGAACHSACHIAEATSSQCINGACRALRTECAGDCPFNATEWCPVALAGEAFCETATGCPSLPVNHHIVGEDTTDLLYYGSSACVLRSCRYVVISFDASLHYLAGPYGWPHNECLDLLDASDPSVQENCWQANRVEHLDEYNFGTIYTLPHQVCSYSYQCAPYRTDSGMPYITATDISKVANKAGGVSAANAISVADLNGAASTGSKYTDGELAKHYTNGIKQLAQIAAEEAAKRK